MADLLLGEFGKDVYVDAQYPISSATSVRIVFSASAGTFSATCSILGANFTSSATGTVFSAGRAAIYTVASGDFSAHSSAIIAAKSQGQRYDAWLDCAFSTTARLISTSFKFRVVNPGDA